MFFIPVKPAVNKVRKIVDFNPTAIIKVVKSGKIEKADYTSRNKTLKQ